MKKSKREATSVIVNTDGTVEVIRPLAMTTYDAATYCGAKGIPVAPKTLEVWRCNGKGPIYRKIGSRVFYRKSDLDKWMEGIEVKTIDPAQQRVKSRKATNVQD